MVSIALVVVGCGGVGRQVLHHIISCRPLHAKQGVNLRVLGVCDSQAMVATHDVLESELNDQFLSQLCELKTSGSSLMELASFGECRVYSGQEVASKVVEIAATLRKSNVGLAVVDCSASSETIGLLTQVVDIGGCVVLANKKPLTSSLEDYDKLVSQPRHIRYESTVGAGLPVISTINRIISSGDPISLIVGCLSGTLGYVMSEVEGGKPFSQVINDAKGLGYTEPDPRDDLSGMDVARKALILARLLGHRINMDSVKVESLYPVEMGPDVMPLEEFLTKGLPLLDKEIGNRIDKALSKGNVLRYVCVIRDSSCEVGLQETARETALGRLKGSDNVLQINSRCYSKPLVIQGAGAGNDTTAAGVLADILDMQDLFQ